MLEKLNNLFWYPINTLYASDVLHIPYGVSVFFKLFHNPFALDNVIRTLLGWPTYSILSRTLLMDVFYIVIHKFTLTLHNSCAPWVVLKPGTERNGTERNERNERNSRRDEDRTYFCLWAYVALHRRYHNVHVAAKVSTYSTESMHCRTRLRIWKHSTRARAFRSPQI